MSLNDQGEQSTHPNPLQDKQKPATRGSVKWIGAAAAAAVVVALAGGGMAFARTLGGGGAQPEDVLPGNAIAFVKVDLNPSAGQKLAVFQLASKFPKVKSKVTSQDTSVKQSTFGSLFTGDTGLGLNYKKDVEPWLGDRIGLGVFPDLDSDKKPEVGLTIAFTDQAAAKSALDRAIAKGTKNKVKFGYAFTDGYVIVSDTTAHATALVKAGKVNTLARSKYAEDVKSLGSDQIAVGWADIAAAYKAVPKDLLAPGGPSMFKGADDPRKASGRYVVGLHADSSFLELNGKGIDIKGAAGLLKQSAGARPGMITSFPTDIFGAATIKGLGKNLGTYYTTLTADGDSMGVKEMLSGTGIDSAKKIETLLGDETGVVVAGTKDNPEFAIRTRGSNTDAAMAIARGALGATPASDAGVSVEKISDPDGIVVSMGADLSASIFEKSGSKLGGSEAFRQALPDAGSADAAGYVNLAKVVPLLTEHPASSADVASMRPFNALGLTVLGGAQPSWRLRLSFR